MEVCGGLRLSPMRARRSIRTGVQWCRAIPSCDGLVHAGFGLAFLSVSDLRSPALSFSVRIAGLLRWQHS